MCFSVSQFIVKIFAIIFVSGDTKYKGLDFFFSVWILITGLNLQKVANNFGGKKEKVFHMKWKMYWLIRQE